MISIFKIKITDLLTALIRTRAQGRCDPLQRPTSRRWTTLLPSFLPSFLPFLLTVDRPSSLHAPFRGGPRRRRLRRRKGIKANSRAGGQHQSADRGEREREREEHFFCQLDCRLSFICQMVVTHSYALLPHKTHIQSCVNTFLLSSGNHSQNVTLLTPKMHHGAIFQPAIPKTWRQECFNTTL